MPIYEYLCANGHRIKRITYSYKDEPQDKVRCKECEEIFSDDYPEFAYLVMSETGKPVIK